MGQTRDLIIGVAENTRGLTSTEVVEVVAEKYGFSAMTVISHGCAVVSEYDPGHSAQVPECRFRLPSRSELSACQERRPGSLHGGAWIQECIDELCPFPMGS